MITVGVVREIAYMSQRVGEPLYISMHLADKLFGLKVEENKVWISYQGQAIWEENIYGEGNWFGIESCDTIARIVDLIDNDEPWQEKHGWKKSDNNRRVPLDEALEGSHGKEE